MKFTSWSTIDNIGPPFVNLTWEKYFYKFWQKLFYGAIIVLSTTQEYNMTAWDVIRNGRVIDTVFFTHDCDLHYVRSSLINHDGYDVDIIVRKAV